MIKVLNNHSPTVGLSYVIIKHYQHIFHNMGGGIWIAEWQHGDIGN